MERLPATTTVTQDAHTGNDHALIDTAHPIDARIRWINATVPKMAAEMTIYLLFMIPSFGERMCLYDQQRHVRSLTVIRQYSMLHKGQD